MKPTTEELTEAYKLKERYLLLVLKDKKLITNINRLLNRDMDFKKLTNVTIEHYSNDRNKLLEMMSTYRNIIKRYNKIKITEPSLISYQDFKTKLIKATRRLSLETIIVSYFKIEKSNSMHKAYELYKEDKRFCNYLDLIIGIDYYDNEIFIKNKKIRAELNKKLSDSLLTRYVSLYTFYTKENFYLISKIKRLTNFKKDIGEIFKSELKLYDEISKRVLDIDTYTEADVKNITFLENMFSKIFKYINIEDVLRVCIKYYDIKENALRTRFNKLKGGKVKKTDFLFDIDYNDKDLQDLYKLVLVLEKMNIRPNTHRQVKFRRGQICI